MKKFHDLKFFGLVAVLAVAMVFIVFSFVQGQVKTSGKPDKPPDKWRGEKYVWSAVILDGPGMGVKGAAGDDNRYDETWQGWVYDESEANVNIGVEIRRAPFDGVDKYWTRFYLEIFYPVQIDFEFFPHGAQFYENTPNALCKYPGGYAEDDPSSMLYFLQDWPQPHPSYQKVLFTFGTDRSVNQNEVDYQQWMNNYHEYLGFSSNVSGPAPNYFKPKTCEDLELFEFSSIQFGGGDYGYFERIGEDIWKVVVGTEKDPFYDYTGGPGEEDDAWATDWYNICVIQTNKKKQSATYDAIFSSQGSLDIKFEILFVRTKI